MLRPIARCAPALLVLGGLALGGLACGRPHPATAERPSRPGVAPAAASSSPPPAARTPSHVDTLLPRAEALRRFQAGSHAVRRLAAAAASRDALVRRFVAALERSDTSAFRRMILTRDEFAFLYYPTAREGRPPYDLPPDLMWFMMVERSNIGLGRALHVYGGKPLRYAGYRCEEPGATEGANTVWGPCVVRLLRQPGDTVEMRLFGQLLRRDGGYKFVSYANKLDA